jgi:opacity protein-like surface antigen
MRIGNGDLQGTTMRRLTIVFALATAGLPAAALAQDMGVDWSGGYVGGSIGYASTDSNAKFTQSDIVGPAPGMPISSVPIHTNPSGLIGSLQLGGNQQFGNFVVGGEAEFGVGHVTTTVPDPLIGHIPSPPGPSASDTVTAGSDVMGGLMLRAGLGVGNFLPYATAGVSAAHVFTTATAGGADDQGWFTGWSVGGGVEKAVADDSSVRLQYLHTDLGGPNFNKGKAYETSAHPVSDSVTVGVNYRFN